MKSIDKARIAVSINLVVLLVLFIRPARAQIETDSSFAQSFNDFKKLIQNDFEVFKTRNDSLFLHFLNLSWKEFDPVPGVLPDKPKPTVQPVYLPDKGITNPERDSTKKAFYNKSEAGDTSKPLPDTGAIPSKKNELPEYDKMNVLPKTQRGDSPNNGSPSFLFFGTSIQMPDTKINPPVLKGVAKTEIIRFFDQASGSKNLNDAISMLAKEASRARLNDWGLTLLFYEASKKLFTKSNDQVLFTWLALLKTGINAKVGYQGSRVFLLLNAKEKLYETSYMIHGKAYYLLSLGEDGNEPTRLSIHENDYPNSRDGLSFLLKQTPDLEKLYKIKLLLWQRDIELKLNQNVIDFLATYPQCELKVYFNAPLSQTAVNQFDKFFTPILASKSETQKVETLLEFVQKAIPYQKDQSQFGKERYLFADETLYYPAADCEDRAVLLSQLIKRYTQCQAIGICYPGHVSLAVNLSERFKGKYLMYKNLKYYFCDPTYLGASCGVTMPEYDGVTPTIIELSE